MRAAAQSRVGGGLLQVMRSGDGNNDNDNDDGADNTIIQAEDSEGKEMLDVPKRGKLGLALSKNCGVVPIARVA